MKTSFLESFLGYTTEVAGVRLKWFDMLGHQDTKHARTKHVNG